MTYENRESKFLYDVSYGFMPREFADKEIIYDEGDEVPEMYFIMDGKVKIGYMHPEEGFLSPKYIYENKEGNKIITNYEKVFNKDAYICAYNVVCNVNSEFRYQTLAKTQTFSL